VIVGEGDILRHPARQVDPSEAEQGQLACKVQLQLLIETWLVFRPQKEKANHLLE